jgi:spore germination protein GerM
MIRVAVRCALLGVVLLGTACDRTTRDAVPSADTAVTRPVGEAPGTGSRPPDAATADSLTIYFSRNEDVVAVRRPGADATLESAMRSLLRGPTASERAEGIHSWFSDTTAGALRSVVIDADGRAIVDFEDLSGLIPNASSSAGSAMLLRELNATVFRAPDVQSVEYRMMGSCDRFWEWLQYGCQVVERP